MGGKQLAAGSVHRVRALGAYAMIDEGELGMLLRPVGTKDLSCACRARAGATSDGLEPADCCSVSVFGATLNMCWRQATGLACSQSSSPP